MDGISEVLPRQRGELDAEHVLQERFSAGAGHLEVRGGQVDEARAVGPARVLLRSVVLLSRTVALALTRHPPRQSRRLPRI